MEVKRNPNIPGFIAIAAASLLVCGTTCIVALSGSGQQVPLEKQTKSLPIDKTKITLKLIFANGSSVKATQLNGGMIRQEMGQQTFGLVPRYRDDAGTVNVAVFELEPIYRGSTLQGERAKQIDSFPVDYSSQRSGNRAKIPFGVQLLQIKRPQQRDVLAPNL